MSKRQPRSKRAPKAKRPAGEQPRSAAVASVTTATAPEHMTTPPANGITQQTPMPQPSPPLSPPKPTAKPERGRRRPRFSRPDVSLGVLWIELRGIPVAAWVCALIAFLNAVSWSLITPPFQLVDEWDHFAYVQQLAETGHLPRNGIGTTYSREQVTALVDLGAISVRRRPQLKALTTQSQQDRLDHDLAQPLVRVGNGDAGVATAEPPLYYALETIPYKLEASSTILERMQAMRVLSAVMAAFTALFAFLFLREALPGVRWGWTVGGLCVALAPLLGFMSSGVNPEAMLYAESAALFFCMARAFRRGLSPRLAVGIAAVTAAGFLTKLNFLGLLPGEVLGLLVLTLRASRASRATALRIFAFTLAIIAIPLVLNVMLSALSGASRITPLSDAVGSTNQKGTLLSQLSYMWQLFFPRLPGMSNDFPGLFTPRSIWFNSFVGLYGWIDTVFPQWVYRVALIPVAPLVILFGRGLVINRKALISRWTELATYLGICAGVMAIVGGASYAYFLTGSGAYGQARYLMPFACMFAGALVLAARGAGRRWGPAAGALIVVLFLAHDVFSQLMVISRYYG